MVDEEKRTDKFRIRKTKKRGREERINFQNYDILRRKAYTETENAIILNFHVL